MDIIGFENYLIYNDGRVYNKRTNKFMISSNHKGYRRLRLTGNGKRPSLLIHRLVAIHYILNTDNKKCVDHINRDKADNRVENLRWVSHLENMSNQGDRVNNTSGHKNIRYNRGGWAYQKNQKMINNNNNYRWFNSKTDALCYKFIMTLKFKAQIVTPILPLK